MGDRAQTTRPDADRKERAAKKKRDAAAAELELAVPSKGRAKRSTTGAGLSVLDLEQVRSGGRRGKGGCNI
jgi:pre-mRNA-splicing helicase BRR2